MAKEAITNGGPQYNALTAGSKITGNIVADNDIRIDGEVEGELDCRGKVVIGEKGLFKGKIICVNAEIHGKLEGEILIKETLSLRQTGTIIGDVKTKVILIEPDAIFNGTCAMGAMQDENQATKEGKDSKK